MDGSLLFAVRLVIASVLGGLIGLQRELAGKPAGLRTNLLICLGSALLTLISLSLPAKLGLGDPARIAAQIVSGIGFLGAGTILQSRHAVHGLTSAATIWVVAAVGMAVGAGYEQSAFLATAFILVALVLLGQAEDRLLGQHVVAMTVRVGDADLDPAVLLERLGFRRRQPRFDWRRNGATGAIVSFSWRGTIASGQRVAAAVNAQPDLELVSWEVEE
jgi:putative Mg2+ transporter-C (MgtC) family protein